MKLRKFTISTIALLLAPPAFGDAEYGESQRPFVPAQSVLTNGAGSMTSAWADFDKDGDLDLAVAYKSGEVRLYANDRGRLTNVGPRLGLPKKGPEARALAWGDFNQDGFPDLYVGARRGGNELYRNGGAKGFTGMAVAVGLDLPKVNTRQVSWIDYDNNGTLDLFIANRSGPNHLFANVNGRFVDRAADVGLDDQRKAVGACWFDLGADGDLDVFIAHQGGQRDALFRNDGGVFTDVAAALGVDFPGRAKGEGGVGCSVADFNGDGHLDIFLATYGQDRLYLGDGTGGFSSQHDVGASSTLSVASSSGDFDNDGDMDLYVTGYVKKSGKRLASGRLFRNEATGFISWPDNAGVLNQADHGVQWTDFDGDGDLDLSLTAAYPADGQHLLLRNNLDASRAQNSLVLKVLTESGHPIDPGSEVRLYSGGELLATRLVSAGDGYNAQSQLPLHFGGVTDTDVTVVVTRLTPNGRESVEFNNIPVPERYSEIVTLRLPRP